MSEEQIPDLSPLDLPDGRSVLFDEPTSGFYRVRLANGEVQAFPARGEATRENAVADLVENPPPPPPLPVPQELTRAQFVVAARRVLGIGEGQVFALIAQLPAGEAQETARDLWENALTFKRANAMLNTLAQMNGNTAEQLDEVFRVGAALDLDS